MSIDMIKDHSFYNIQIKLLLIITILLSFFAIHGSNLQLFFTIHIVNRLIKKFNQNYKEGL